MRQDPPSTGAGLGGTTVAVDSLVACRMYDGALTGLEDKEKIRKRSLSIDVLFILDLKIGL